MVPFQYRRIDQALTDELRDILLIRGESLILLGTRFAGKRHLINRFHELLKESSFGAVVRVKFFTDPPIISEARVGEMMEDAIKSSYPDLPPAGRPGDVIFGPLDRLLQATDSPVTGPVFLLASNIDSMAHHITRSFLRGLRRRIDEGLVAVLSGEYDLSELVRSSPEGLNFANLFVLEGYQLNPFKKFLEQFTQVMQLEFDKPDHAAQYLWKMTGGNVYLLRMILWSLIEVRVRRKSRTKRASLRAVKVKDIESALDLTGIPGIYGAHVFRHGTQLIAQDPGCWGTLEKLISGATPEIDLGQSAPTRLEMAGLAVRKVIKSNKFKKGTAHLEFASPLQKSFATHYYDDRRFGDLYAGAGRWEEAFGRYEKLKPEQTMRPSGVDDRAEVEATVVALCSSMHSEVSKYQEASKSLEPLKRLLIKGCHYVLGFSEVSFWQRDTWREGLTWKCLPPKEFSDKSRRDEILLLLSQRPLNPKEFSNLPAAWAPYVILELLPAVQPGQQVAVVISDLRDIKNKAAISSDRKRLARQLLKHFGRAYSHAIAVDGLQIRLKVRDQHVEIMNSIFGALGSDVRDAGQVLLRAASGLRKLEYSRVLFSLVDPEEQRIEGVLDCSDDPSVDLAQMIDLPLKSYDSDLQALVIHTGMPYPVPDASQEPLANPNMVKKAKIKSFALIPLLNPLNNAIGTIHVERENGVVASTQEIADLLNFGRQVAVAIEQSDRVNMLESSLNKIPEPIVIADRAERLRYANEPAAELLNVPRGWQTVPSDELRLENLVTGNIIGLLLESLTKCKRLVSHFEGIGQSPTYRGAAITDVITDWRPGKTVGGLLHVQDLNYLLKVFRAALQVAEGKDTSSALTNMLHVFHEYGHKWGRLYLMDEGDPNRMVSSLSFGFTDPASEKLFHEGEVPLVRVSDPRSIDWRVIDKSEPIVFCWKDDLAFGEEYITPFGLRAVNAPNPIQPPEIQKSPGDFWIDFPITTRDKVLGKLCLQADENLRPEDFELLKVLCNQAGDLFSSFIGRAKHFGDREKVVAASAASKTIGTMAHNLVTRFANFSGLHYRYTLLQKTNEKLKKLNETFEARLQEAMDTATRAKELLGAINPRWQFFDLVEHVRDIFESALPGGAGVVECSQPSLEVQADKNLMGTAILELVQNSKEAALEAETLHVTLTVEPTMVADKELIRLTLKDNGRGIPLELHNKIFEEFYSYRPERTTGTGLGLGFVRRVFEAHGGFIYAGVATRGAEFVMAMLRHRPESIPAQEETNVSYSYH